MCGHCTNTDPSSPSSSLKLADLLYISELLLGTSSSVFRWMKSQLERGGGDRPWALSLEDTVLMLFHLKAHPSLISSSTD